MSVPCQLPTKRKRPRAAVDGAKRKRGSPKRNWIPLSRYETLMLINKAKPQKHFV